jgi:chromosome segregation ATPase
MPCSECESLAGEVGRARLAVEQAQANVADLLEREPFLSAVDSSRIAFENSSLKETVNALNGRLRNARYTHEQLQGVIEKLRGDIDRLNAVASNHESAYRKLAEFYEYSKKEAESLRRQIARLKRKPKAVPPLPPKGWLARARQNVSSGFVD